MTVLPRRSTTCAPAGALIVPRAPTAVMRPLVTTNAASSIGGRRSPVSRRAPSNTSGLVGVCAPTSHDVMATRPVANSSLRIGSHSTRLCGMTNLGMNERAWMVADDCATRADELRVAVHSLASGARVIDAGIDAPGGLGAGRALAELCMGGLGHIE